MTSKAFDNATDANRQQGGRRNLIINSAMQVAQRGTSVTGAVTGYQTIDRWRMLKANTSTAAMDVSQSSDSPDGFASSLKVDVTATEALGTSEVIQIQQRVEGQNLQSLAYGSSSANSITFSFWVKSDKTGTYIVEIIDADNSKQVSKSYTVDTANTWEYKTVTIEGNTSDSLDNDSSYSFQIGWWLCAGTNYTSGTLDTTWATANDANRAVGQVNLFDDTANNFYITGVQLEVGIATPFEHRSYGEELALCQRYYAKSYNQSITPGTAGEFSGAPGRFVDATSSFASVQVFFPVTMRASPTVTLYNPSTGATASLRSDSANHPAAVTQQGENGCFFYANGSSISTSQSIRAHYTAEAEL